MSLSPSFLVIDKPPGITSHDVVDVLRAVTGVRKVGHTGTLDPFATGVLPMALGPATRMIQFLDESVKVYDATIQLGAATDTGDPTGEVVQERSLPTASRDEVEALLQTFVGDRMQVPPAFSAVKHKGKPLYHYARQGIDVQVEARPITISAMELLSYDKSQLRVVITCSRGTYARVLAHEIAEALGSAGHLTALCRRRSGPFFLDDAISMASLAQIVSADPGAPWDAVLLKRKKGEDRVPWNPRSQVVEALAARAFSPMRALAHLPLCDLRPVDADRVLKGAGPPAAPDGLAVGDRYLFALGDQVLGIGERGPAGPQVVRTFRKAR
ncbi:MAG: tRNA pseudouridine(55) synthase TruB [Deltaproteobacteria bacterium]|nr:MAG: tRNA pseudouridine(55) synthase TruB [Deltaproteobacteria bacterium]